MNKARKVVLETLTDIRVEEEKVKAAFNDRLGDETTAVTPDDIRLMFAGHFTNSLLKLSVAMQNRMAGLVRDYGEIYPKIEEDLQEVLTYFEDGFATSKKYLTKIGNAHQLSEKLCKIKGFTPYQLALIMAHVKDISRFDTPSKLMVYAGVGVKYGHKVCKKNLNTIRQAENADLPDKDHLFGYNTALQGRMHIIADNLLCTKGYFFNLYNQIRPRLEQRAINERSAVQVTAAMKAEKNGDYSKARVGEYYMVGRKNQSLTSWSNRNARWRIVRTLLHLIYKEWRESLGLPVRNPYPIEYLGHHHVITLEDVLKWEAAAKEKKE